MPDGMGRGNNDHSNQQERIDGRNSNGQNTHGQCAETPGKKYPPVVSQDVHCHTTGESNNRCRKLSCREDSPNTYSTQLKRALNFRKRNHKTLNAPVKHRMTRREAGYYCATSKCHGRPIR